MAGRFAALQHRDFTLLWLGQGVSLLGTQVQRVAIAWQLYLLTKSAWSLGLLGLFRVIPIVILALGSGVVADALDRRKLLLAAVTILGATSATLAALTATGHISSGAIYGATFLAGCANAFENPTRQALVTNLVPRKDIESALALNITNWQIASVLGPTVAGFLLGARSGIVVAYTFDAASFGAVIVALVLMQHRQIAAPTVTVSFSAAFEGLRFVFSQPVILGMTLLDFLGTFFADAILLLPIFAVEVLHVGARGLGWLGAARSVGAVCAALIMSWIPPVKRRGWVVLVSVAIYGLANAAFGASRWYALSLALLALAGAADTVSMVVRQTVRQLLTPDEMRGRMTAVAMIFFVGGPQLGEVEAGAVARWFGAPASVIFGGLVCAALAIGVAVGGKQLREHRAP